MEAEQLQNQFGWIVSCNASSHGGESLTSSVPNAIMSFGFTGTALDVYYEMGPTLGAFSVTIDDAPPVIVDAKQSATTFQNRTTIASELPSGMHSATITCTSLICDLDYFNVPCD